MQRFGSSYTDLKLKIVGDYIDAYISIMRGNETARQFLSPVYIDGFAGSGKTMRIERRKTEPLFEDLAQPEAQQLYAGSPLIALSTKEPFDKYIFIEKSESYLKRLRKELAEFGDRVSLVDLRKGDANEVLKGWASRDVTANTRALVFLDPYGMSVEWQTLEHLAKTGKVDLWLLFPLGQAVVRLLTLKQPPPAKWAEALTRTFGTDAWLSSFYKTETTTDLFDNVTIETKREAKSKDILDFFVTRLETIFPHVCKQPAVLYGNRGNPLFVLCFAAANPNKGQLAVKLAEDMILRRLRNGG